MVPENAEGMGSRAWVKAFSLGQKENRGSAAIVMVGRMELLAWMETNV